MKLVIISHTEHYKTADNQIVGWSPTVNEINHLAPHLSSINHVAMFHNTKRPPSVLGYSEKNIKFTALPVLGGKGLLSKLKTIYFIPKVLKIVRKSVKEADAFQLRTPTGIGVFLIPYLTLFFKTNGWYKYAGNWNQDSPPLGYRIQRFFLKKQSRIVTINGNWEEQPKHCLTFENPCLTDDDIKQGIKILEEKKLSKKINFCYVGRLETQKGVGRIIEAFKLLTDNKKNRVGDVHLVGDGNEKTSFENSAKNSNINFIFHGYLDRNSVINIYKKSHFFLMPTTASEGFPKVIAEALNFGCVPAVSSVSAIGDYIKHKQNGFIVSPVTSAGLKNQLNYILDINDNEYRNLLNGNQGFLKKFTFSHYTKRILTEILN